MSNKVIHKYPLELNDSTVLMLPTGAEVLFVGEQEDRLILWAEVDAEPGPPEARVFAIAGTGQEFKPDALTYLNSVQTRRGYVWHVYEATVRP